MTAKPRVLISTAWWPSKTSCFTRYAHGIGHQLERSDFDAELFVTTAFAPTKFQSIVAAMTQAQQWAQEHEYTHVLNVEADKVLFCDTVRRLLAHRKAVVYPGRGGGSGLVRVQPGQIRAPLEQMIGWGVVLVETEVLGRVPFNSYVGEYTWPDHAWWKRLAFEGIDTWVDFDTPIETLQPAAKRPSKSFNPNPKEVTYGKST